jgi:uncharacterized membrane protein YdjX (TVP38/TMEM64 family)
MAAPRNPRILALIGFPLLLAALFTPIVVFRNDIWRFFSSANTLKDWVAARGTIAPLLFIAIQAIQVIVFMIPGEVPQIAGGYLFGVWLGTLLSIAGILLGSAVSFLLARLLGVPFVHALFPKDRVERVERLLESRRSKAIFFLLFLIPGIPKDVLCYLAGLSPMKFPFFIAASFIGRLPGILGSAFIGSAAAEKRWVPAAIVLGAAVILFGVGYLARARIETWIERISGRKSGKS